MAQKNDAVCRPVQVLAKQVYEAADEAGSNPDRNRRTPPDCRVGGEYEADEPRLQTAEQPRDGNGKQAGVEDQTRHAGFLAEDVGQEAARKAHRQCTNGRSGEDENEDNGNDTQQAHRVQCSGRFGGEYPVLIG